MDSQNVRERVLRETGASGPAIAELLEYNRNQFDQDRLNPVPTLPLPDEPFAADWSGYLERAKTGVHGMSEGVLRVLRSVMVQLNFPVSNGMSKSEAYLNATRSGVIQEADLSGPGIGLIQENGLEVRIHATAAGRIPVIVAGCREDFVLLVQAITGANEPVRVPDSMGAVMVGGYRNWDRVRKARRLSGGVGGPLPKESYLDRFILLSRGGYSGVTAAEMGLEERDWMEKSLLIRLEHECAHYFTRRQLGSMKNNLFDEMLADYMGITAVTGGFRADWFLRFMGLQGKEGLRAGGRFWNYRGQPPLSDESFEVLQRLVRRAAQAVEQFDRRSGAGAGSGAGSGQREKVLMSLCRLTLDELASEESQELLQRASSFGRTAG